MTSNPFTGSHAAAYAEGPPRKVPGFADLHKMMSQLLAERVPVDGRLLVLGAGGGLELKALADDHAGWIFDGIDPSADMLKTAEVIAAAHLGRIALREGYIEDAPDGPFDGATCILTFHFIALEQRLEPGQLVEQVLWCAEHHGGRLELQRQFAGVADDHRLGA